MKETEIKKQVLQEFKKAEKTLKAAKALSKNEFYEDSASRAYYAAFHAVRACLFSKQLVPKGHKGLSILFAEHFVKKGLFPRDFSRLLTHLRENREESDYGYVIGNSQEDAAERLLDAEKIINGVRQYLRKKMGLQV